MSVGLLGFPLARERLLWDRDLDEDDYALALREVASGVEGGALTGGVWSTLVLTRVVTDDADLVIRLTPAGGLLVRQGRYRARSCCVITSVEGAYSRLWDATVGAYLGFAPMFSGQGGGRLNSSTLFIEDEFTLARDTEVRLEQMGSASQGAGWAKGMGFGDGELDVHGYVELWRVPDK